MFPSWEVNYVRNIDIFTALFNEDTKALKTACETANSGDQCAIDVCKTEMDFTIKIATATSVGKTNRDFKHDNGYNPLEDGNCPIKTGGVASERSCCGEYPARFPFKNYDGVNKCCGMKTYDSSVLDCCTDGKLKFIGAC